MVFSNTGWGCPKAVEEWGRAGRARGEKNGARSATEGLGAAEQANKQASRRSEQRQARRGGGKLAGHTCRARGEELGRGA